MRPADDETIGQRLCESIMGFVAALRQARRRADYAESELDEVIKILGASESAILRAFLGAWPFISSSQIRVTVTWPRKKSSEAASLSAAVRR